MLRTFGQIILGFFSGVVFWPPSILVHAISGASFGAFGFLAVNLLAIVATTVTVRRLVRANNFPWSGQALLALHVTGVWVLGPACLLASASAGGGGSGQEGLASALDARMLLFPPGTFIGATYDGTLGAVALVTVALPVSLLVGLFTRWWPRIRSREGRGRRTSRSRRSGRRDIGVASRDQLGGRLAAYRQAVRRSCKTPLEGTGQRQHRW
jgi:hypothetical protein